MHALLIKQRRDLVTFERVSIYYLQYRLHLVHLVSEHLKTLKDEIAVQKKERNNTKTITRKKCFLHQLKKYKPVSKSEIV